MANWANMGRNTGPECEWLLMTTEQRRRFNLTFAWVVGKAFTDPEIQALAWPR